QTASWAQALDVGDRPIRTRVRTHPLQKIDRPHVPSPIGKRRPDRYNSRCSALRQWVAFSITAVVIVRTRRTVSCASVRCLRCTWQAARKRYGPAQVGNSSNDTSSIGSALSNRRRSEERRVGKEC